MVGVCCLECQRLRWLRFSRISCVILSIRLGESKFLFISSTLRQINSWLDEAPWEVAVTNQQVNLPSNPWGYLLEDAHLVWTQPSHHHSPHLTSTHSGGDGELTEDQQVTEGSSSLPRPPAGMAGLKRHHDGKIAGLYDLDKTLGRGHFAVVKLARHVFTGEKVCLSMSVHARATL